MTQQSVFDTVPNFCYTGRTVYAGSNSRFPTHGSLFEVARGTLTAMSTQILVNAWPPLAVKSFQALTKNSLNSCGWNKDGHDQSESLTVVSPYQPP